jgi:hypothetical protein
MHVRPATIPAGPLFITTTSLVRRGLAPTLTVQMRQASTAPVGDWRRRRLIAAGFDASLATRLACDDDVDLHELLVLLDRGCPPELAARIVAPLDPAPRR